MGRFGDRDWILLFAPDMYMAEDSLRKALIYLSTCEKRGMGVKMLTYWKDWKTVIDRDETFYTFAINPSERFEFSSKIKAFEQFQVIPGVVMHHLSWVRTDADMAIKLKTWSHADRVDKNWFKEVWKGYKVTMKNLNPLDPLEVVTIKVYNLPKEIRSLIEKYRL